MERVVIVGGGISGLICAHVFQKYDVDVTVVEPNEIGGEFLSGGLKYIHKTKHMEELFDDLGLVWSRYTVKGGILLRGEVRPYPSYLKTLPEQDTSRILSDHFRKTRKMEPGDFGRTAMNDPAGSKPRRALRCYFPDLIKVLAENVNIKKSTVKKIFDTFLLLDNSLPIYYDYLISTVPLWVLKRISDYELPDGMAMKLNVASIHPKIDPYSMWDYVYTPYTPEDCIHRVSPGGEDYVVEVNGELDEQRLHSDLNFLFRSGWFVNQIVTGLKGHLLPLKFKPKLPPNVKLLGRFAKWDPRATADATLEDSMAFAKEWFGDK